VWLMPARIAGSVGNYTAMGPLMGCFEIGNLIALRNYLRVTGLELLGGDLGAFSAPFYASSYCGVSVAITQQWARP
jgi:hypothetical protein